MAEHIIIIIYSHTQKHAQVKTIAYTCVNWIITYKATSDAGNNPEMNVSLIITNPASWLLESNKCYINIIKASINRSALNAFHTFIT